MVELEWNLDRDQPELIKQVQAFADERPQALDCERAIGGGGIEHHHTADVTVNGPGFDAEEAGVDPAELLHRHRGSASLPRGAVDRLACALFPIASISRAENYTVC